jgi:hypothetical protein
MNEIVVVLAISFGYDALDIATQREVGTNQHTKPVNNINTLSTEERPTGTSSTYALRKVAILAMLCGWKKWRITVMVVNEEHVPHLPHSCCRASYAA